MRARGLSAFLLGLGLGLLALFATVPARISGQAASPPSIDNDDIGGVVTGAQGPEAGVWVIAETRSTPTRLIKIVVTDDRGRYVWPALPAATPHQSRGSRRSGTIRCARPARRQLRRMGARLRSGGFAENTNFAR